MCLDKQLYGFRRAPDRMEASLDRKLVSRIKLS
jgi:hypothetical protein